jgi:hypothetical protein
MVDGHPLSEKGTFDRNKPIIFNKQKGADKNVADKSPIIPHDVGFRAKKTILGCCPRSQPNLFKPDCRIHPADNFAILKHVIRPQ